MRLLFKSNTYKLSEKSTVGIDLSNLSGIIIRKKMAAVHFHLDMCVAP